MCTQISRKTAPRVSFVGAGDLCTLKWNVLGVLLLLFLFFLNQCGTRQLCYFAISIDKTFCLNTVHTELVSFIFSVILLYESASMVTLFLCPPPTPLLHTSSSFHTCVWLLWGVLSICHCSVWPSSCPGWGGNDDSETFLPLYVGLATPRGLCCHSLCGFPTCFLPVLFILCEGADPTKSNFLSFLFLFLNKLI